MLLSRWSSLAPLALIALACAANDDTPTPASGGGAGAPPGGTGNPTGGVSGTGNPNGGASGVGVGGTGGSGATVTGGSAGVGVSGAGGTVSGAGGSGVSGSSAGGTAGTAGAAGTAGGGTGGTGPMTTCTITPTSSVSQMIPTVGIVTFTTDLAGVTDARIEFGRDMNYGMTAPVDRAAMNNRTLLLGMKPATMYNYRIVLTAPAGTCTSGNNTIMTGAAPSGLPTITRNPMTAQGLYGGFLITGGYAGTGSGTAYIIDADGTYVWWFRPGSMNVTGARMSYDGKYMWINAANVPETQGASVYRVSMDGMMSENLSSSFTGQNHQMLILPDETVAFYAYSSNGCDDIKERSPAGMVRTVVNSRTAQGLTSGQCHVNGLDYSPMDQTYLFSDRDRSTITKVRRDNGQTVWVAGGANSDFTGMTWDVQHGIDVLDVNRFVFFNNGASAQTGSVAIELLLDLQAMSMSRPWSYTAMPAVPNQIMGDVQRLPNGNTIVAYSTRYVVHEVNAQGQLLQALQWPNGASHGYIEKRATLYGPPPR